MAVFKFFIVGVGRSGTSLLQSMLAAHPQVTCLPETAFIRRMVFPGYLHSIFQRHGQKAVLLALAQDDYFGRTELDASKVIGRALARGGLLDAAVYREMLSSYAGKDKAWAGDKDPRAIEFMPLLAEVLQDVHVIHVFRDPRDVLASKKKAAWSRKGHVWKHVFANRVQFRIGCIQGPALFGPKYHMVCYEDLLAAPEEVLDSLCKELGIQYDSSMLSFGNAAKKLVSEKEMSWKKETLGPLLACNMGKWKKKLHPREVRLTELCCREAIEVGNYKPDDRNDSLDLMDRLWVLAGRLLIVLATKPYIIYRNLSVQRTCKRAG